jgi:hypothetical protein
MELKKENNSVVLCGRGKCCPTLKEESGDLISITDDNGNSITIKKEQAALIPKALKLLEDDKR